MMKGGDTIFTRNNAQVIEQQAVRNPMRDGQYFTNMTEILWSDGTITFGCLICGEQTESRPQLSIHVGKAHNPKPAKTTKTIKFKAVKAKGTRPYTKRNKEYWANGGNINQNRKTTTDSTLADKEIAFWKAQAHRAEAENRKLKAQLKALLDIK
jgi:uncharacterized C2H2 Zn-finger protein